MNKPFTLPKEIIEAAINEDLVLFCGAGISTEGKNVLPFSFYNSIREELGITDDSLSFSEIMQEYCKQPNGRRMLLNKIKERFQYIHSFSELERQASKFHRELAEIYQIKTIITTNWDTYFEQFCGATPITIPEDFSFYDDKTRHVLKIHGSIDNLGSIIATSDDYKKCFERLQNGVIGATLKSILATKTVVFIGFSFGDEDFSQIIKYLRDEMGEVYPHIYVVTLDDSLKNRQEYDNSTYIVTSGTFFIQCLKKELIERKTICNSNIERIVDFSLELISEAHMETSEIDLREYPSAMYALLYQDGIVHALERYLQMHVTGEYNNPCEFTNMISNYEDIINRCYKDKNYFDMSYYEGYKNGLIYIGACSDCPQIIKELPIYYLPNAKKVLSSFDVFLDEVKRTSNVNGKYLKHANKFIKCVEGKVVIHHPPYCI